MPYETINKLPDGVKNNLPKHAQHIYKEAFNNAWERYNNSDISESNSESREELAHRVAWSAVKKKYKLTDGEWHEK